MSMLPIANSPFRMSPENSFSIAVSKLWPVPCSYSMKTCCKCAMFRCTRTALKTDSSVPKRNSPEKRENNISIFFNRFLPWGKIKTTSIFFLGSFRPWVYFEGKICCGINHMTNQLVKDSWRLLKPPPDQLQKIRHDWHNIRTPSVAWNFQMYLPSNHPLKISRTLKIWLNNTVSMIKRKPVRSNDKIPFFFLFNHSIFDDIDKAGLHKVPFWSLNNCDSILWLNRQVLKYFLLLTGHVSLFYDANFVIGQSA